MAEAMEIAEQINDEIKVDDVTSTVSFIFKIDISDRFSCSTKDSNNKNANLISLHKKQNYVLVSLILTTTLSSSKSKFF